MKISKPILIIGAPRSGTTLLFSIFSSHPDLWSLYSESGFLEKYFHPQKYYWENGNSIPITEASEEMRTRLHQDYYQSALNYQYFFPNKISKIYADGSKHRLQRRLRRFIRFLFPRPDKMRLVEKTPKNCLRIPFFYKIFPDAYFIFISREPRANINSLIEGWQSPQQRYQTYKLPVVLNISGYQGQNWNFILPPGWQNYTHNCRLEDVCAFQYRVTNQIALDSLETIPNNHKTLLTYESLIESPENTIRLLCKQLGIEYRGGLRKMAETMPAVNTKKLPNPMRWKKNEDRINLILDDIKEISLRLGYRLNG